MYRPRAITVPRDRHRRFVNYSRTVRTQADAWHEPRSEPDVVEVVSAAAARRQRIKVVGAGHSFSTIAQPVDHAMTLDRLSGLVDLDPVNGVATLLGGTRLRTMSTLLAAEGLTLPIFGSIRQQSIAGAIATGTHGSSLVHGNLASIVTGLDIVDGTGRTHSLAQTDERLAAARVHLGALGVVTRVSVKVEPHFSLRQVIENVPVTMIPGQLNDIATSAEYVKVWWLPHARHAQVVRYERTSEPDDRRPSANTRRWIDEYVMHQAVFPSVVALAHRRPGIVPRLNRVLSTFYLGPARQVGPMATMLNTPNPIRHRETEAAVPMALAGEAWDRTVYAVIAGRIAADFPLEARFVRGDDAWMSPAFGRDTCQLGAYSTDGPDCERFFAQFWEAVGALEARPHWGKELAQSSEAIATLYPRFADFVALRNEMDPDGMFANPFLERVLGPAPRS